jgi:hypothetical protein
MMSLGRLCVMLSRHTTHLTWIHDNAWRSLFSGGETTRSIAKRALAVRRAICGKRGLRVKRRAGELGPLGAGHHCPLCQRHHTSHHAHDRRMGAPMPRG